MSGALPTGYSALRPTMEDADALADLVNTCSIADCGLAALNAEQIRAMWQLPGHRLDADDVIVVGPDGAFVAAAAQLSLEPYTDIQAIGVVHPGHLGRGIGSWLVDQVEERAAHYRALAPAGHPVMLRTQTWSGNKRAAELLTLRGYRLERVFRIMQIDFDPQAPLPEVHVPDGIVIRTFVRGQDEELAWLAAEESFRDHWNHHDVPLETWTSMLIDTQESFDPTLWWLALDGDDVAGVALCDATAPGDPDYGLVSILGVRRPWRGRGLAKALLATTFNEFQRRGRRGVRLGVDSESPTGANLLYERAGMHAVTDAVTYLKELPAEEAAEA